MAPPEIRPFTPSIVNATVLRSMRAIVSAADIAKNVERQRQLLGILDDKQAAFRSTFGFSEWRRACEVWRFDVCYCQQVAS